MIDTDDQRQQLGRQLDLAHEPSVTGVTEACALCGVSTEAMTMTVSVDGPIRAVLDRRHVPSPAEVGRARSYLTPGNNGDHPREAVPRHPTLTLIHGLPTSGWDAVVAAIGTDWLRTRPEW